MCVERIRLKAVSISVDDASWRGNLLRVSGIIVPMNDWRAN